MKISDVCQETGLTKRAIRFYTEKGLLCPATTEKGDKDYYDYSDDDVRLLRAISTLRKLDISVDDIRRIISGPENIAEVVRSYRQKSRSESEENESILRTLSNIKADKCGDIFSLAENAENAGQASELPHRDIEPDFSKFDDMIDEEEKSEAYMRFHDEQIIQDYRRRKMKIVKRVMLVILVIILLPVIFYFIMIMINTRPIRFKYEGTAYLYSDHGNGIIGEAEITLSGTLYTNWSRFALIDGYEYDRYAVGTFTIDDGGGAQSYEFYYKSDEESNKYNNEADYTSYYDSIWINFCYPYVDYGDPEVFSGQYDYSIHYDRENDKVDIYVR